LSLRDTISCTAARCVDRKFCSAPVRILADLTSDKLAGPEHVDTAPERLTAAVY